MENVSSNGKRENDWFKEAISELKAFRSKYPLSIRTVKLFYVLFAINVLLVDEKEL